MNFTREDFFHAGVLHRSFGLKGEMRVSFEDEIVPILQNEEMPFLFIDLDDSIVPFQIDYIEWGHDVLIKFKDAEDRDRASFFAGRDLYIPYDEAKERGLLLDGQPGHGLQLEGFSVTVNGVDEEYVVHAMERIADQSMMILIQGDREVMVPFVEDYILELDRTNRCIRLELPHGLLDL